MGGYPNRKWGDPGFFVPGSLVTLRICTYFIEGVVAPETLHLIKFKRPSEKTVSVRTRAIDFDAETRCPFPLSNAEHNLELSC